MPCAALCMFSLLSIVQGRGGKATSCQQEHAQTPAGHIIWADAATQSLILSLGLLCASFSHGQASFTQSMKESCRQAFTSEVHGAQTPPHANKPCRHTSCHANYRMQRIDAN